MEKITLFQMIQAAKNIKIKKFRLSGETKLNLASTQTIQIEELEFGKDNSDISLISQYVKINNLAVLDSGTDAKSILKLIISILEI